MDAQKTDAPKKGQTLTHTKGRFGERRFLKPEDTIHGKQITRKEALAELYPTGLNTPLRAEPMHSNPDWSYLYQGETCIGKVLTNRAAAIVAMSEDAKRLARMCRIAEAHYPELIPTEVRLWWMDNKAALEGGGR